MIDVGSGDIVAQGLSMPHSPRLYRRQAVAAQFGCRRGRLCRCCSRAGSRRSLSARAMRAGSRSAGDHAVIGLSLPRENRTFSGLALDEALAARDAEPRCGLAVIDIDSGDIAAGYGSRAWCASFTTSRSCQLPATVADRVQGRRHPPRDFDRRPGFRARQRRLFPPSQTNRSCTNGSWTCHSVPVVMFTWALLSTKLPSGWPRELVMVPLLDHSKSSMPSPL